MNWAVGWRGPAWFSEEARMAGSKIVFAKGTQLTVYIDNRKGTLAALTAFLAKHGINVYGLTLADTEGHGYARLIVDDTEKARQLVEDSGELVAAPRFCWSAWPTSPANWPACWKPWPAAT
jgi:hypothetical protein